MVEFLWDGYLIRAGIQYEFGAPAVGAIDSILGFRIGIRREAFQLERDSHTPGAFSLMIYPGVAEH